MGDQETTPTATADTATSAGTKGAQEPKTFTQEELDNILSKRLGEQNAKAKAELEKALLTERSEAERLAKLSAEEKERETKTKYEAELKARDEQITLREMRLTAIEEMEKADIPISWKFGYFQGYITTIVINAPK